TGVQTCALPILAEIRAGDGAGEAKEDDEGERVIAGRSPRAGREQERLAGKRNARALDQNAKPRRRITERVDDGGPVHLPTARGGRPQVGWGESSAFKPSIYWTTR